MRLEHHLVGGYVRYISPHIIIIIIIIRNHVGTEVVFFFIVRYLWIFYKENCDVPFQ